MNKAILMGRLTRDVDVRYSAGENQTCIARYTLAVERKYKREGQPSADFISCVAMGRSGEFAEKYFHKGTKVVVSGHIQTGSYTNKDGQRVYTTDVVVEDQEFAESKAASQQNTQDDMENSTPSTASTQSGNANNDFMDLPDDDLGELPFK